MPAQTRTVDRFAALRIDKKMSSPAYLQIAEAITGLLKKGTLPAGYVLPPERTLCEQFGVSRMTLRQAMSLVERDGFIASQRGRGTFVTPGRLRKQQQEMLSFSEDIRARGGRPGTVMISFAVVLPSALDREFFDLNASQRVYEIVRLRLKDHVPLAVESVRIPQFLCPGLERFDLARNSLYRILEQSYNLRLDHSLEEISAELPKAEPRKLLNLPRAAAVLVLNRRTFTEEGRAVELARSVYRGDLYSAVVHSQRRKTNIS